jgi:putative ABC transport system permease protein
LISAIVSEPFANKHHVHTGDTLRIPLGARAVPLTVAGIYYDYANDRGFVLVDRATLLRYLPESAAHQHRRLPAARRRQSPRLRRARNPPGAIPPHDRPERNVLRRGAVEVFDRTFAVTYALEAVAIIVAMLGAANSLLALVLDRRREIGLIRYLGADRGQVRKMILTEAGLLGLLAGLLGLALGTALSLVLIYVVNKQSFGWTIQFHPPRAAVKRRVPAGLDRYDPRRRLPRPVRRPARTGRRRPRRLNSRVTFASRPGRQRHVYKLVASGRGPRDGRTDRSGVAADEGPDI